MNDYRAPTPLWYDQSTVMADLSVLRISQCLRESLVAWQRYFDDHIDSDGCWDHAENAQAHGDEGRLLQARLCRALPETEIVLDLWLGGVVG